MRTTKIRNRHRWKISGKIVPHYISSGICKLKILSLVDGKRDYFLASKDLKNIFEISRKERFTQITNSAGEI